MKKATKNHLLRLLAELLEFFKFEIEFGDHKPRLQNRLIEFRTKIYESLGKPTMADLDKLKGKS